MNSREDIEYEIEKIKTFPHPIEKLLSEYSMCEYRIIKYEKPKYKYLDKQWRDQRLLDIPFYNGRHYNDDFVVIHTNYNILRTGDGYGTIRYEY